MSFLAIADAIMGASFVCAGAYRMYLITTDSVSNLGL